MHACKDIWFKKLDSDQVSSVDKFICEFADSPEKAKNLIEDGFEYIGELYGEPTFRKRK